MLWDDKGMSYYVKLVEFDMLEVWPCPRFDNRFPVLAHKHWAYAESGFRFRHYMRAVLSTFRLK